MNAPRWIGFLATFVVLMALYLLWAWAAGVWHSPRIQEASEVLHYYLWIVWAMITAATVTTVIGFPSAIVADRLFQAGRRTRSGPYIQFAALALVLAAGLFAVLEGEHHFADALMLPYFFSAQSVLWKVSYEVPNHRKA